MERISINIRKAPRIGSNGFYRFLPLFNSSSYFQSLNVHYSTLCTLSFALQTRTLSSATMFSIYTQQCCERYLHVFKSFGLLVCSSHTSSHQEVLFLNLMCGIFDTRLDCLFSPCMCIRPEKFSSETFFVRHKHFSARMD